MDLVGEFLKHFEFYAQILIWLIIVIYYIRPGKLSRLHLTIIVAGFLILTNVFDFFLAQYLVLAWIIFNGTEIMIGKYLGLTLLIIIIILGPGSFVYYLLSLMLYLIVLASFIFSASGKLQKMVQS
ncbi:MAG: hypothetical protein ABIE23_00600 [archaeon]